MKETTQKKARRWLSRNAWKIALHNTGIKIMKPSDKRTYQACSSILLKEKVQG